MRHEGTISFLIQDHHKSSFCPQYMEAFHCLSLSVFKHTHTHTHTLTVQTIHTCFMPLNRNVTFLWNNVLNGVLSSPVPSQNYILSKYLILVLLLQMQLCMCMCMCVCLMFAHHMVNSRMSDWAWFFHPYVLVSSTLLGT